MAYSITVKKYINLILISFIISLPIGCSRRENVSISMDGSYWIDAKGIIYFFDIPNNKIGFGRTKADADEMAMAVSHEFQSPNGMVNWLKNVDNKIEIIIPNKDRLTRAEFQWHIVDIDSILFDVRYITKVNVSNVRAIEEPWASLIKSHVSAILSSDGHGSMMAMPFYLITSFDHVDAKRFP